MTDVSINIRFIFLKQSNNSLVINDAHNFLPSQITSLLTTIQNSGSAILNDDLSLRQICPIDKINVFKL